MFVLNYICHVTAYLAFILTLFSCKPLSKNPDQVENFQYLSFKPSSEDAKKFWQTVSWSHPKVKDILKDQDFMDWLLSQNTETKLKMETSNASEAISLLEQYKAETYYYKALRLTNSRVNMPKAVELLRQASMYGNVKASFFLGELFREGLLVEKSRRKAFRYLTKARLAGNKQALISLQSMGFMRYD